MKLCIRRVYMHTDCVDLLGIPESEATAFALVKQMKIALGAYTQEELADFRPFIRKILLQNSRRIVMALRSRNLGPARRSNKVRRVFYTFSVSDRRRCLHTGKLRVHHEAPN